MIESQRRSLQVVGDADENPTAIDDCASTPSAASSTSTIATSGVLNRSSGNGHLSISSLARSCTCLHTTLGRSSNWSPTLACGRGNLRVYADVLPYALRARWLA
jgi:hypothetical protein